MNIPLIKYFVLALKKYSDFNGRANKREYWWFFLANLIITLLLSFLLGQKIANLWGLITLIPGWAVGARRLHDIGKSGWMQLWMLIPIIGWIWLIILWIRDGDPQKNAYGEPSKA